MFCREAVPFSEVFHNNIRGFTCIIAIVSDFFVAGSLPHLVGRTCFRESLQDEWLVVELLLQLSRQHQDFVIRYTQLVLVKLATVLRKKTTH